MFQKTENDEFINVRLISKISVGVVDFGKPSPDEYFVQADIGGRGVVLKKGFRTWEAAEGWVVNFLGGVLTNVRKEDVLREAVRLAEDMLLWCPGAEKFNFPVRLEALKEKAKKVLS